VVAAGFAALLRPVREPAGALEPVAA
jgi:hypothetical protein